MITVYVHDARGLIVRGKTAHNVTLVDSADGTIVRGVIKRDWGRRFDWRHTLRVIAAARGMRQRSMRRRIP